MATCYRACSLNKNGKDQVSVPLWCQYDATWRDVNFAGAKWVIVSNYESWVMDLVDAITNKSVRDVARGFVGLFRKHFQKALSQVRKANRLENPLSDSDSENATAPSQVVRTYELTSAVVELTLAEFTVTVLNSSRRMALKVDEAAVKFVTGWIVPLIRLCATRKPDSQVLEAPSTSPSHGHPSSFCLRDDPTPNIRDKVCWNPTEHKWKVFLKSPKGRLPESFAVDPNLDAQTYEQQKVASYWRAVDAWNRLDDSKRIRIPTTRIAAISSAE